MSWHVCSLVPIDAIMAMTKSQQEKRESQIRNLQSSIFVIILAATEYTTSSKQECWCDKNSWTSSPLYQTTVPIHGMTLCLLLMTVKSSTSPSHQQVQLHLLDAYSANKVSPRLTLFAEGSPWLVREGIWSTTASCRKQQHRSQHNWRKLEFHVGTWQAFGTVPGQGSSEGMGLHVLH